MRPDELENALPEDTRAEMKLRDTGKGK